MTSPRVAIVGGGNLGFACARAFLISQFCSASELRIIELNQARRSWLSKQLPLSQFPESSDVQLASADILIFCVKPQEADVCLKQVAPHLGTRTVVVSPMTGVTVTRLASTLNNHRAIVRCMPNLGAQLGISITPFVASEYISNEQKILAQRCLSSLGKVLEVRDENLLDVATAVSASGPGYVFYFMEHFERAAVELGFSEEEARLLGRETLRASAELLSRTEHSALDLRLQVASKGGTTEAATKVFEGGQLGDVLRRGIEAAYRRARELAK